MMTEAQSDLTPFPINTVLFPDARLWLRIFEPRYLDPVATRRADQDPQ